MEPFLLTASEAEALKGGLHEGAPLCKVFWPLERRARHYCEEPGWSHRGTTVQWWHAIADYAMTVAGTYALRPSPAKAAWLRETAMGIARRSTQEWVGPAFRSHDAGSEPVGNLETAHLTWAIVFTLDLAPDVFTEPERQELLETLREKSLPLCRRWFDQHNRQNNWGMVLLAGLTLAAATLRETETLEWCAQEYARRLKLFQDDGSYGESFQYASYAIYGLTLTGEALRRVDPQKYGDLSTEPFARTPAWWAQGFLYLKPLEGWGPRPMPRSANFNDSAAVFRPHGDVLMHIAARAKETHPREAGLARWLFERFYCDVPPGPEVSSGTFGLVNEVNCLSLLLYPAAADPLSPEQAGLAPQHSFDCGETYVRNTWQSRTILAIKGEDQPLRAKNHRHRDSGSFILAHNRERILLDPGHSCYRSVLREFDLRTNCHNACTFSGQGQKGGWQRDGEVFPAEGHRLISTRSGGGQVSIVGYELAPAYGDLLNQYARFWFLCGEYALFVVDWIEAGKPVTPSWHWLFNNRDGLLDIEQMKPGRIVGRRGDAGFKFSQPYGKAFAGPNYQLIHDAYHPLPAQKGEGRPGSGIMFHTHALEPTTHCKKVHALALDNYAQITGWHVEHRAEGEVAEISGRNERWALTIEGEGDAKRITLEGPESLTIQPGTSGQQWQIT